MIQSMTGFGKSAQEMADKKIIIEIKSLNSKGMDINTRLHPYFKEMELDIRKRISEALYRGKVEINLTVEFSPGVQQQYLNSELIQSYQAQLKDLAPDSTNSELLALAVRMPDAVRPEEKKELAEKDKETMLSALDIALSDINQFRTTEGKELEKELASRVNNILAKLDEVSKFEEERVETIRTKINQLLQQIAEKPDENRFEQEMIYYMEKLDITEEKIRLRTHCEYFLNEMKANSSNGKKLGFISQEMGREINTLGSKSNHSGMQKLVVEMKDELEKIKEQTLNVL